MMTLLWFIERPYIYAFFSLLELACTLAWFFSDHSAPVNFNNMTFKHQAAFIKDNWALAIAILNTCISMLFCVYQFLFFCFFGSRQNIPLKIFDHVMNVCSFKIILIGAILEPDLVDVVFWTLWLSSVSVLNALLVDGMAKLKVLNDFNLSSISFARASCHIWFVSLALLSLAYSCLSLKYWSKYYSLQLLLLYDILIIFAQLGRNCFQYYLFHREFSGDGNNCEESAHICDLATEIIMNTLSSIHFFHVITLNGLSFALVDILLLMHIRASFEEISGHWARLRFLLMTRSSIDDLFPTVSVGGSDLLVGPAESVASSESRAGDGTSSSSRPQGVSVSGGSDATAAADMCSICLATFESEAKRLPCGHLIHSPCLKQLISRAVDKRPIRGPGHTRGRGRDGGRGAAPLGAPLPNEDPSGGWWGAGGVGSLFDWSVLSEWDLEDPGTPRTRTRTRGVGHRVQPPARTVHENAQGAGAAEEVVEGGAGAVVYEAEHEDGSLEGVASGGGAVVVPSEGAIADGGDERVCRDSSLAGHALREGGNGSGSDGESGSGSENEVEAEVEAGDTTGVHDDGGEEVNGGARVAEERPWAWRLLDVVFGDPSVLPVGLVARLRGDDEEADNEFQMVDDDADDVGGDEDDDGDGSREGVDDATGLQQRDRPILDDWGHVDGRDEGPTGVWGLGIGVGMGLGLGLGGDLGMGWETVTERLPEGTRERPTDGVWIPEDFEGGSGYHFKCPLCRQCVDALTGRLCLEVPSERGDGAAGTATTRD